MSAFRNSLSRVATMVVLGVSCAHGWAAFIYENQTEFTATGDFDGNGLSDVVVVDRASGTYRLGYQMSPGTFTWAAPRASGIDAVTGLAVGRLAATSSDALAFTAPEGNRINVFAAVNPAVPALPLSVFSTAIGPSQVVAIDVGGANNTALDDFVIGSVLNNTQPFQLEAARNQGASILTVLNTGVLTASPRRANQVAIKSGNPAAAALLMHSGANDVFKAYQLAGGTLSEILSATVGPPFDLDYTFGFFNSGSSLAQFLFYKPGVNGLMVRPVQEPSAGTFHLAPGPAFDLGDTLRQVFTIPGTASPRLLVIFGAGGSAGIYDFDGSSFPVPLQAFTAPAGEIFTGAAALAGGNVMLLTGAPGGGSSSFRHYNVEGASYTLQSSGALPSVSAISRRANVMTFQFEPFVASSPNLLQSFNAGDWSSLYVAQPGSQASVTFESFGNSQGGLGSPTIQALSPINTLAQFSLVNQYRDAISLFRLTPALGSEVADVKIVPAAGTYKTSIEVSFNTADPQNRVFYRLDSAANWTLYTAPFWLFKDTTVSFYATPLATPTPLKSSIRQAAYHFSDAPQNLDSDGDGVPDYVEIAKGLDPVGSGADADGDGYPDLNELINGTDPANQNSIPSSEPRQDLHGAVDLVAAPLAVDGLSWLAANCATGTVVHGFDLAGDLLSLGSAAPIALPGLSSPAAVLSNVTVDVGMKLVTVVSEPHFDIVTSQTDKRIGRELIRLLDTAAFVDPVPLPKTWTGSNLAVEAVSWINAASNQLNLVARKQVAAEMNAFDTLAALLVEKKVSDVFLSRGRTVFSNLTLFPFRSGDAGRPALGREELIAIEAQTTNGLPGFQLRHILSSIANALGGTLPADPAQQLKALAWEVYRVSSASNNIPPGAQGWPFFPSPVDTLRDFLRTGVVHSNYLASSSALASLVAPAFMQSQGILNAIGGRPVVTLSLKIRSDTFVDGCVLLDTLDGTQTRNLVNAAGPPFEFVDAFFLPPGTVVAVRGYDDVTNSACSGTALEVIYVALFGPPQFSSTDGDGDLLPDALELALFGDLEKNAFGDLDGDGFSNLQEVFDGTDPTDGASKGAQPVSLSPPAVQLQFSPTGQIKLQFQWPAAYVNKVQFGVFGGSNLSTPLSQLPAVQNVPGNGTVELSLPHPGTPTFFYQIVLQLK